MRVVVTGAAGFVGSCVLDCLVAGGHDVVAVDLLIEAAHGARMRSRDTLMRLDVRDDAALDDALRDADAVCHQAAVVGAGVSQQDAPAYASHNDFGTAVLLAAMERAGVERLVLASSMVVYGEGRYRVGGRTVVPAERRRSDLAAGRFDPIDPDTGATLEWGLVDEDSPLRPRSTYAASKVAQEHYAQAWAAATGGSVVALRYHNVYGPYMPRDTPYSGVAAMFRSALESGIAPTVFEDGAQMRDFVHVDDVAVANRLALEAEHSGFAAFNVCSGVPISILEVATALAAECGGPSPVVTGQFRSGDVRHVVADPRRAADVLGFRAKTQPLAGLASFAYDPLRDVTGTGPPRP